MENTKLFEVELVVRWAWQNEPHVIGRTVEATSHEQAGVIASGRAKAEGYADVRVFQSIALHNLLYS